MGVMPLAFSWTTQALIRSLFGEDNKPPCCFLLNKQKNEPISMCGLSQGNSAERCCIYIKVVLLLFQNRVCGWVILPQSFADLGV